MNWQHIQYFRVAAEEQHFIHASERLNITQPALSMAIRSLEQELGTALFVKCGRNVELTQAGQTFLVYVSQAITSLELGMEKIKQASSKISGLITISSLPSFYKDILCEIQSAFESMYPKINFVVSLRGTVETLFLTKENVLDIGICMESDFSRYQKHLEFTEIARDRIVLIVPPDHPFANRREILLEECRNQVIVNYYKSSSYSALVEHWFREAGVEIVNFNIANKGETVIQNVARGGGIALIPDTPSIEKSGVKTVRIKDREFTRKIFIVTRKSEYLSPVAKTFLEYLFGVIQNDMTIMPPAGHKRLRHAGYYLNVN